MKGSYFFCYRVTPLSGQSLQESLGQYGIPAEYEAMIGAGKGRYAHDILEILCWIGWQQGRVGIYGF